MDEMVAALYANGHKPDDWITLDDENVRHVWFDGSTEHYVGPGFYEDSGTPIDEESGEDMAYVRTEINVGPDVR